MYSTDNFVRVIGVRAGVTDEMDECGVMIRYRLGSSEHEQESPLYLFQRAGLQTLIHQLQEAAVAIDANLSTRSTSPH